MPKLTREQKNKFRYAFKHYAVTFGMHPRMLDKKFSWEGKEYKVAGLRVRKKNTPVLCRNLNDRQLYDFPAWIIAQEVDATVHENVTT